MLYANLLRTSGLFVLLTAASSGRDARPPAVPARATATVTKAVAITPPSEAPCPKTVTFEFTVTVTKPGVLYFRRITSGGYRDPNIHTVSFPSTGEFELSKMLPQQFSLTLAKPFNGWVGIHIETNPAGDAQVEPTGQTARLDLSCPTIAVGAQRAIPAVPLGAGQTQAGATPGGPAQAPARAAGAVAAGAVQAPARVPGAAAAGAAQARPAAVSGKLSRFAEFSGLQSVPLVQIKGSASTFGPHLTTLSPYFQFQVRPKAAGQGPGPGTVFAPSGGPLAVPVAYVEVEQTNIAQYRGDCFGPNAPTGVESGCHLKWGDNATVKIGRKGEKGFTDRFNRVSFRWTSAVAGFVGGHWQISRYPFTVDAQHWQDTEIAGLADSGEVTEAFADSQGFHYFQIDLSTSANPSLARSLTTVPRVPVHMAAGANVAKPAARPGQVVGPVKAQPVTAAGAGAQQGALSWARALRPSSVRWALAEENRTFYVRIVPLRGDGKAGVPTLPVEVTVTRARVCQPPPPEKDTNVWVRPPSARVVSFYMTSFVPDWIRTTDTGRPTNRVHYVTIAPPPGCEKPPTPTPTPSGMPFGQGGTSSSGWSMCSYFWNTLHGQVGYHYFVDPPPEPGFFDTLWNVIKAVFTGFEAIVNAVSKAWSQLEAFVVQVVADAVQVISFNTIKCGESDVCKGVLEVALKTAMAASGIPPTLPNASELENLGADYLAKVAAEEIGAGGALETAEEIYGSLPPNTKAQIEKEMKDGAAGAGSAVATAFAGNTAAAAAQGAGSWFMLDPLYYQPHPAYLMVEVYNPNQEPTDPVTMHYGDNAHLYKQKDPVYVPSLKPGESTSIPIVLEEYFDPVYSEADHCTRDSYYSECNQLGGNCIPCYWNRWVGAAEDSTRVNGGDVFVVSFSAKVGGRDLNLGPSSSGKLLGSDEVGPPYDDYGTQCTVSKANVYLKYPDGWKYTIDTLWQDLRGLMWLNYTFSEGDRGFMRTK